MLYAVDLHGDYLAQLEVFGQQASREGRAAAELQYAGVFQGQ